MRPDIPFLGIFVFIIFSILSLQCGDGKMANLFYSVCFFQEGVGFSPHTIMPICLPPDDKFHDNERQAAVVGLGQRVATFRKDQRVLNDL
jgi:hypothetical protein